MNIKKTGIIITVVAFSISALMIFYKSNNINSDIDKLKTCINNETKTLNVMQDKYTKLEKTEDKNTLKKEIEDQLFTINKLKRLPYVENEEICNLNNKKIKK